MAAYLLRRVLLILPTMIGIMLISFVIVQFAPGGPVEQVIAKLTGTDTSSPNASAAAARRWAAEPSRSSARAPRA